MCVHVRVCVHVMVCTCDGGNVCVHVRVCVHVAGMCSMHTGTLTVVKWNCVSWTTSHLSSTCHVCTKCCMTLVRYASRTLINGDVSDILPHLSHPLPRPSRYAPPIPSGSSCYSDGVPGSEQHLPPGLC